MDYRVIERRRLLSKDEADAILGDPVPVLEPNVNTASVIVDADTGDPVVGYLPMEAAAVERLRWAVLQVKYSTTKRATGVTNVSRTFGMSPRKVFARREACRPSGLAAESPEAHHILTSTSTALQETLEAIAPGQYDRDKTTMGQVEQDWRMADDSLWTSGVVNKSSTLPYHRDGFNFNTWSAMPVVRRNMVGGYLHMPEWDVTLGCRDGYAAYFCGYQWVHGVTPMEAKADDAYRFSVVYYALRGMKDCFTYAIEQANAVRRRTEREEDIARGVKGEKSAFEGMRNQFNPNW